MKVLLVDPWAPTFGLNLPLGYLSSSLKRNAIDVRTLDLNNRSSLHKEEDLYKAIETYRPDLIGFSVLYVQYKKVLAVAPTIKERFGTKIIVGGPQITLEEESVFSDCSAIDFAMVGEGEFGLPEVCRALEGDGDLSEVKGLICKENGSIKKNERRMPFRNLNSLPFPDYESFGIEQMETYRLMTSRGCPYDCGFCFRQHAHDWRPRTPENVIEELRQARRRYGIKSFIVHDESFNINKKRVIAICEGLRREQLGLTWTCAGIRADSVDDDIAAAMHKAGCRMVSVGIETLMPDVFERIGKREKIDHVVKAVESLKRNKIKVLGYFMIGLPGDSYNGVMETYRKAKKLKLTKQSWANFMPLPKTRFYKEVYDDPQTRMLHDYRDIEMIWLRGRSVVQVAFDNPSFPADEKLEAYYKIHTRIGNLAPNLEQSLAMIFLQALSLIVRHAPHILPLYIARYSWKFLKRFLTKATPIQMLSRKNENLVFRPDFIFDFK